ncbi:MAG: four helix bundle protein [Planctomycetota bacterium]|jgi:four helix bundle protein
MKKKTNRKGGAGGNFDHERLDVYRLALEYLAHAHKVCKSMPVGSGSLRDEIGRAAESIVLNIPEGNAKPRGSKDRHNYFRRAAGSTAESSGAWDVARIREFCSARDAEVARKMLLSIFNMLHGLIG